MANSIMLTIATCIFLASFCFAVHHKIVTPDYPLNAEDGPTVAGAVSGLVEHKIVTPDYPLNAEDGPTVAGAVSGLVEELKEILDDDEPDSEQFPDFLTKLKTGISMVDATNGVPLEVYIESILTNKAANEYAHNTGYIIAMLDLAAETYENEENYAEAAKKVKTVKGLRSLIPKLKKSVESEPHFIEIDFKSPKHVHAHAHKKLM